VHLHVLHNMLQFYGEAFIVSFLFGQLDSGSVTVGRDALASTLGGIGYFYGQSKISLPKASKVRYQSLCK